MTRKTKAERKATRKRIECAKRRTVNFRRELREKRRKNP